VLAPWTPPCERWHSDIRWRCPEWKSCCLAANQSAPSTPTSSKLPAKRKYILHWNTISVCRHLDNVRLLEMQITAVTTAIYGPFSQRSARDFSLTGPKPKTKGVKIKAEGRNRGWGSCGGAAIPSPPARGLGECCELPQRGSPNGIQAEPRPPKCFPLFSSLGMLHALWNKVFLKYFIYLFIMIYENYANNYA